MRVASAPWTSRTMSRPPEKIGSMGMPERQEIEALVASAITAIRDRSADAPDQTRRVLRRLVEFDRPDEVDAAFIRRASPLLAPAWARGWTPLDLLHASEHVYDAETATFVACLVGA